MSRQKLLLALIFTFFISGCNLFSPYVDSRRNPGVKDLSLLYSGPSKPDKPVICYNPLITNTQELQQVAVEQCQKNQTGNNAKFVKITRFDGKLLLPYHAHYECITTK